MARQIRKSVFFQTVKRNWSNWLFQYERLKNNEFKTQTLIVYSYDITVAVFMKRRRNTSLKCKKVFSFSSLYVERTAAAFIDLSAEVLVIEAGVVLLWSTGESISEPGGAEADGFQLEL